MASITDLFAEVAELQELKKATDAKIEAMMEALKEAETKEAETKEAERKEAERKEAELVKRAEAKKEDAEKKKAIRKKKAEKKRMQDVKARKAIDQASEYNPVSRSFSLITDVSLNLRRCLGEGSSPPVVKGHSLLFLQARALTMRSTSWVRLIVQFGA